MDFIYALGLVVFGALITLTAYLRGYEEGRRAGPPNPPNEERPQEAQA